MYIRGPGWFIDGDIPCGRYAFVNGPPGPGWPIGLLGIRAPGDVIRKPKRNELFEFIYNNRWSCTVSCAIHLRWHNRSTLKPWRCEICSNYDKYIILLDNQIEKTYEQVNVAADLDSENTSRENDTSPRKILFHHTYLTHHGLPLWLNKNPMWFSIFVGIYRLREKMEHLDYAFLHWHSSTWVADRLDLH